ncbi:MAG: COG3650 family protein [Tsuneonella sp.]
MPIAAALALAAAGCHGASAPSRDVTASGEQQENQPFSEISPQETAHFTGTEPFWGGEVSGSALTYSTPDNPQGDRIAVQRFGGRGGVSWSGTWQGQRFTLALTKGKCSDGMRDRLYPFVATLVIGDDQREGCGWSDSHPASAPQAEAAKQPAKLAASELVLAEWRKADNRAACAPLSFTADAAGEGAPRSAVFSGGWGVAFDRPGVRSAFGIAGTGLLPEDAGDEAAQRARLMDQWPLFRTVPQVPQPAFAGYGVEGAEAYPEDNPDGRGLNSLAYVRVAGQQCDYNVWSRLGRAHLEALLENLRLVPTA